MTGSSNHCCGVQKATVWTLTELQLTQVTLPSVAMRPGHHFCFYNTSWGNPLHLKGRDYDPICFSVIFAWCNTWVDSSNILELSWFILIVHPKKMGSVYQEHINSHWGNEEKDGHLKLTFIVISVLQQRSLTLMVGFPLCCFLLCLAIGNVPGQAICLPRPVMDSGIRDFPAHRGHSCRRRKVIYCRTSSQELLV